jgi:non-ribosomal peptide synthetase component E (peptide arylation enzyme)
VSRSSTVVAPDETTAGGERDAARRHIWRIPIIAVMLAFAADRLAAYKLPEAVVVVDALPLTTMDKLDRRRLAALASER